MNINDFAENLKNIIWNFSLTFEVKITDLTLENLIKKALVKSNLNPDWNPGSHAPGADIFLPEQNIGFSVKSGRLNSKTLTISSFRTTKYNTLQEKLDYFDGDGKNFSSYLVLARNDSDVSRYYRAIMIPAELVEAASLQWEEMSTGWKSEKRGGVQMKIVKKMSDQFWFTIDRDVIDDHPDIKTLFELEIDNDMLGTYDFELSENMTG